MRALLARDAASVLVVDNLLSAERENLPDDPRVDLIEGSITDDRVLAQLPADLDQVFHLSTYHGNQSSMADPLADHENNTFTTLKLYEHIKDFPGIDRVVYAGAGCTVAEKTFEEAKATDEDAPVSLWLDSPYQISKMVGEFYSNYYFSRHGLPVVKARFQNVYGPGEVLGAGQWRGTPNTVWRNVTPTFIYRALKQQALPVENGGIASRDFIYVDDIVDGLLACATARARRDLQPRQRRRDDDPRARRAGQRAHREPDADRAHPGPRLGPLGQALRRRHQGPRGDRVRRGHRPSRWARADDRLDPREPRLDRGVHGAPRRSRAGGPRARRHLCVMAGSRPQAQVDAANAEFWNELCGTTFAQALGITDLSEDSLRRFDAAYLDFYPYLSGYVPESLAGQRVLEIGLGFGTLGQLLAARGADYFGLDISAGPVELMRDRLEMLGTPEVAQRVQRRVSS